MKHSMFHYDPPGGRERVSLLSLEPETPSERELLKRMVDEFGLKADCPFAWCASDGSAVSFPTGRQALCPPA